MTTEGQQAKKVLQKVLNRAKGSIVIKVSKTDDQYGRYLVDTWVRRSSQTLSLRGAKRRSNPTEPTPLSLPHRSSAGTISDKKNDGFLSLQAKQSRRIRQH